MSKDPERSRRLQQAVEFLSPANILTAIEKAGMDTSSLPAMQGQHIYGVLLWIYQQDNKAMEDILFGLETEMIKRFDCFLSSVLEIRGRKDPYKAQFMAFFKERFPPSQELADYACRAFAKFLAERDKKDRGI